LTWVDIDPAAARMPHILASHSLNGAAMRAHLTLYRTIMFGESGLSRAECEANRGVRLGEGNDT
jgi:hypothetical protein